MGVQQPTQLAGLGAELGAALKGALADPSLAAALRAEGYEPLTYVKSVA